MKDYIHVEKVSRLYSSLPFALVGSVMGAIILVTVQWQIEDHTLINIWLGAVIITTFFRASLYLMYSDEYSKMVSAANWERRFVIGVLLAGLTWGSAAFLMFPKDDLVHQLFLAFVVGGVSAAAIATLSVSLLSILLFLTLSIIPLTVRFFSMDLDIAISMGVMLVLFYVMMSVLAFRTHKAFMHHVDLQFESNLREEALRESEERFKLAMQGANDGLWDWDFKSDEVYYSPRWKGMLGYEPDELKNHLDTWAELVHSDDKEWVLERVEDYLKGRSPSFEVEMKMLHKSGTWMTILSRAFLVRDETTGTPIRLVGTHVDITERKRSEKLTKGTNKILEMIASDQPAEDLFKSIVRLFESRHPGMHASILLLKNGKLYTAHAEGLPNRYNRAIEGLAIGPNIGSCGTAAFTGKRYIAENISEDSNWGPFKELALSHNLQACWSEPVLDSDGAVLGTFAMYYNRPTKPSNTALEDIASAAALTSIVISRDLKSESHQKLSSSIEQSGEVIMITDKNSVIEYVNPAFTTITGYSRDEAIGNTPKMLQSGKHDREFYKQMWRTLFEGNTWRGEVVDRRKDGTLYPAMLSISPVLNNAGEVVNYVGVHKDISELKLMEEQFLQAQKMEAVGTLVGGIAHDFNNVLSGMIGFAYLAKQKAEGNDEIRNCVHNIEKLGFRGADMIGQLLTFARKDSVELKVLPLTTFLKEAFKFATSGVPENIAINFNFPQKEIRIRDDATQIQQLLMNLVNNARDAVETTDKPKVSIELEEFLASDDFMQRHHVSTRKFALLTVKDNGSGISEESRLKIFEPFYTTKESGKGTGLGLAMVYGSVKRSGGIIEVESEVGEGTSFHIYLPVEESLETSGVEAKEDVIEGNGETLLLIDDDEPLRSITAEILSKIGYQVLEAKDGEDAIDMFTSNHHGIDLIISDLIMPNMGGAEAARVFRQIRPDSRVVFVTGYDLKETLEREGIHKGATVLSKPFSAYSLSHAVHEELSKLTPSILHSEEKL